MRKTLTIAAALVAAALWTAPAMAQKAKGGKVTPSAAVQIALSVMPGAEPLGVKRKGGRFIVRLKQGGSVVLVAVDAQTGDVSPMQ